jgi:hypothetical protein
VVGGPGAAAGAAFFYQSKQSCPAIRASRRPKGRSESMASSLLKSSTACRAVWDAGGLT